MRPERVEPGPGQESVWDYPRPPAIVPYDGLVEVRAAGVTVAATHRALRVLETSQPPAFYLPAADVRTELLEPSATRTSCEWKGTASYWDLVVDGRRTPDAAWSYEDPVPAFEAIRGHLAFYPRRVDACLVDGEQAAAGEGSFYGGWITSNVVGPFKGGAGTAGW